MANHVHGGKLNRVEILRADGTPWQIPHVKHVVFKAHEYALYVGEHGPDRKPIIVPRDRVDHLVIVEEGTNG